MSTKHADRRALFDVLVEAVHEADRAYGRMLACSGAVEGTPEGKVVADGMAHVATARRLLTEALRLVEGVPTRARPGQFTREIKVAEVIEPGTIVTLPAGD